MMLVIYLSSLIRSILALHKLIDNREQHASSKDAAVAPVDAAKAKVAGADANGDKAGKK